MNTINPIVLKNMPGSDIRWKNFKGQVTERNRYGIRQFALFLDPEQVDIEGLIAEGWKVKERVYDGTDTPTKYYLNVDLNYNYQEPPIIDLVIDDGEDIPHGSHITESNVAELDDTIFTRFDIVVRPRWTKNTFSGQWSLKAMLGRLIVWSEPNYYKAALEDFDDMLAEVIFDDDPEQVVSEIEDNEEA